jgi:hypothetical protein
MRLRLLPGLFLLRRLVRELSGIREQLTRQTDLLARLANQIAPPAPVVDRDVVAAETGLDYVDSVDQYLIQQFRERTLAGTGHLPDDDEVLNYLADEKTVDLHQRLNARDRELERLAEERRR